MKPRTKFQFDVISQSKELNYKDDFILDWAKNKCIEYKGFATKSRVVCMQCGEKFSPGLVNRKRAVCPHCATRLKVETSRKTTDNQQNFIGYAQIVGEYQVVRYFIIYSYHAAGKSTKHCCYEILQFWIKENGKHQIVARNHTLNNYVDSWNGDMEIREDHPSYYYQTKYDIYTEYFHPHSEIKGIYTKIGINTGLAGITFLKAIHVIPKNPRLETLLKCKQFDLLNFFEDRSISADYWSAIKICLRNKYKVKDAKIWIDYLDLLRHFNKDTHNAKYVCPANLKAAHDRLVEKKRKIQDRQQVERKRKQAQEWEQQFKEMKAHLLGICFKDDQITIKTLDSVQEYLEEGDALHHCVFTNEYFLKKDSICLSARIEDKPIETIEISLSKMDIVQCRGQWNKDSPYHDRIVNLVKNNINTIKRAI